MENNKKYPEKKKPARSVDDLSAHLGKLPPQAIEIEEVVLGALMLERDAIDGTLGILNVDDFYKEAHQEIFKAIIRLFDKSEPVDIKTVTHELREMGKLEMVGGAYYISQLTARVNSAANIENHSRIIQEQALKRELIQLASEIQQTAYEDTQDVFKLIDYVDDRLMKMNEQSSNDFVHLGDKRVVTELVDQIAGAKKANDNQQVIGVPSGFVDIDRITGGFRGSKFIVIAARPGMGKSAMVACIMKNAAYFDHPVALFSLEMKWDEVGIRMIAMESEIVLENLTNGQISTEDFAHVVKKSNVLVGKPMYIDDTAAMTIFQIRTKARLMQKKYGIKMLIVDYLQLASGTGNEQNREAEIAKISRGLKQISKELDIPVIGLSQLNRDAEKRADKRPQLSDLRESGAIEQDADMVMLLYRPDYYGISTDPETGISLAGLGEVIIPKNRGGKTGSAWLKFIGKYTKWDDNIVHEPFVAQSVKDIDFTITLPAQKPKDTQNHG